MNGLEYHIRNEDICQAGKESLEIIFSLGERAGDIDEQRHMEKIDKVIQLLTE